MTRRPYRFATLHFHGQLRQYAVCVAVHPSHPLARTRKVGLEQVAVERLITYTLADYPEYHAWLSNLFAPLKRPPHIAEEHDGSTSLIASVEAGRGVALVQKGFECFAGPRLRIRPLTPAPPPFVVGIAYRRERSSETAEFRRRPDSRNPATADDSDPWTSA